MKKSHFALKIKAKVDRLQEFMYEVDQRGKMLEQYGPVQFLG